MRVVVHSLGGYFGFISRCFYSTTQGLLRCGISIPVRTARGPTAAVASYSPVRSASPLSPDMGAARWYIASVPLPDRSSCSNMRAEVNYSITSSARASSTLYIVVFLGYPAAPAVCMTPHIHRVAVCSQ
jgi:hypothetical protein